MTGWINLDAAGGAGMPQPAPDARCEDARFEDSFRRWLPAGDHAVELIGAADCDPAAADWALDEVWLPSRPRLKRYPRIAVGHVDGPLDVLWERTPI
ncbi:hypothetical protein ACEN88_11820 [Massilia sp. CT11-108]|uniref:hypothetical protein n=1 Tax=Massilia sp. CT11-108 TaxID=3393900 RepID=UPI0039A75D85